MILVFAENLKQYRTWLASKGLHPLTEEYHYIDRPDDGTLMCIKRGTKFTILHSYWEHERWGEFKSWIIAKDLTYISKEKA